AALLAHLITPGLDIRQAFGMVRDDVMKSTDNKQEPYLYGSLGGAQMALVSGAPAGTSVVAGLSSSTPAATTDPNAQMRADYEFAERVGTKAGWSYFLQHYPHGFYANLAKAQLDKLSNEPAGATAAPTQSQTGVKTAALPTNAAAATANPVDVARALQSELKRVGCFAGAVDGD